MQGTRSKSPGSSSYRLVLVPMLMLGMAVGCDNGAPDAVGPVEGVATALAAGPVGMSMPPGLADVEVATLTSFDPFSGELPESIAVDRSGNIYVSMSALGEIWKLSPAGSFLEVVATFPVEGFFGVSGLRFNARGLLYAANASTNADARGVWKIGTGGDKERIAGSGDIAIPNDVAISPDGVLYITDSAGAVWRVMPEGAAEVWVQDPTLEGTGAFGLGYPLGANGIVIVRARHMPLANASGQSSNGGLVVANVEKGLLVYVPILPDGSAGQPGVAVADPSLFGLDGITVDARGTIYGVSNAGNKVIRISRDGSEITEIVSGPPLDFPTGLTFGTGRNRHTLYVVSSAFIHALHDPPTFQDANPAVITVRVGAPGVRGH